MLGVGYLLLRKPLFAALNWVVTVVVVVLLLTVEQGAGWVQLIALLVWLAAIAHGWVLSNRHNRRHPQAPAAPGSVWPLRLVAFGVTAALVLTLTGLRIDAWRIESAAADAHRADDCQQTLSRLDGLGAGHRLVDPSLVTRDAPASEAACRLLLAAERQQAQGDRLQAAATLEEYRTHPAALWQGATGRRDDLVLAQAGYELKTALIGDTGMLSDGFAHLSTVLARSPGRADEAGKVLDGFLAGLPVEDPCVTARITDWLATRPSRGDELDRAADIVPKVAPAAILGCADKHLSAKDPEAARTKYRQLLDDYPQHELAARAKQGEHKATLAIQLADVKQLLTTELVGRQPRYCDDPAPYGGAKPYRGKGHGPYPTLLFGQDSHRKQLPVSWRAKGAADAVLVVCAGELEYGSVVDFCQYNWETGRPGVYNVSYFKRKIPVHVYEVRTGKLVTKGSVQISGRSCPRRIYAPLDTGPDPQQYVSSSKGDVRSAYKRLIDP
ncbi:tetratricopeptide repeat protein [Flindersiella endophytica]